MTLVYDMHRAHAHAAINAAWHLLWRMDVLASPVIDRKMPHAGTLVRQRRRGGAGIASDALAHDLHDVGIGGMQAPPTPPVMVAATRCIWRCSAPSPSLPRRPAVATPAGGGCPPGVEGIPRTPDASAATNRTPSTPIQSSASPRMTRTSRWRFREPMSGLRCASRRWNVAGIVSSALSPHDRDVLARLHRKPPTTAKPPTQRGEP
jgi:hypothetical protein